MLTGKVFEMGPLIGKDVGADIVMTKQAEVTTKDEKNPKSPEEESKTEDKIKVKAVGFGSIQLGSSCMKISDVEESDKGLFLAAKADKPV